MSQATIGLRLVLFASFTCVGYVVLEAFLRGYPASLLLFNTFLWLLVFRCVDFSALVGASGASGPGKVFRSPFFSLVRFTDLFGVAYCLCIFGYWYLFWYGISLLPAGTNASGSAIAILSLSAVVLPVAAHFARPKSQRTGSLFPFVFVGLGLAVSIALMELNTDATDLSTALADLQRVANGWLAGDMKDTSPADTGTSDQNIVRMGLPAALPGMVCLALALLLEAIGDYLDVRRNSTPGRRTAKQVSEVAYKNAAIYLARQKFEEAPTAWLATIDTDYENEAKRLEEEIQDLRGSLISELENDSGHKRVRAGNQTLAYLEQQKQKIEAEYARSKNALTALGVVNQDILTRRARRGYLKDLLHASWNNVHKYCVENEGQELERLARDYTKKSGYDLVAVAGMILSVFVVIADPSTWKMTLSESSIGVIAACALLGILGSSARMVFVAPILEGDETASAFVPPIYAVRPILLFALSWLMLDFFGLEKLAIASPYFELTSSYSNALTAGWIIGAAMAFVLSIVAMMMAIARYKAYKKIEDENLESSFDSPTAT
ncbi:MAG: hypothetical protein AAGM21_10205 [Pseudomonadota bacterium]